MGPIRASITLGNPIRPELKSVSAKALVDTGALHLCIPQHIALQLGLEVLYQREVVVANGTKQLCSYVGPVEVRFENRACYTGALVLGDEVLLGAVPMEDMDVILSPALQSIVVNPENPNIAGSIVKRGC